MENINLDVQDFHVLSVHDIKAEYCMPDAKYNLASISLKHTIKTIRYTTEELKWYMESAPLNSIVYNLYTKMNFDIMFSIRALDHLRKALQCSLTYDYYDEICKLDDEITSELKVFCDMELNKKNLLDSLPDSDIALWEKMRDNSNDDSKAYAEKQIADSIFCHDDMKRIQNLVQTNIAILTDSIDSVRKYRYNRTDEELGLIYTHHLEKYKQEIFPEKWEKFKRKTKDHELRYENVIKSNHWIEVKNQQWRIFCNSDLGEIYSEFYLDGDKELAKRISNKNISEHVLQEYFYGICLQEALDKEIIDLKEIENNADPDFRIQINVEQLVESLKIWFRANPLKSKEEWIAVYCAMRDATLIKNDLKLPKWCDRMNLLFPKMEKECTHGSIRKFINKNKPHTQPITAWNKNVKFQAHALLLYNKFIEEKKSGRLLIEY